MKNYTAGVSVEVACPTCGTVLLYKLSSPEQYPKNCICGAPLPQPGPDSGLREYLDREIAKQMD